MVKARRCSVVFAWISLALCAFAEADSTRSIDLPSNVPVELALPGLQQAVAADPAIVRADADLTRSVLTLTGVGLFRNTVVYAWTSEGLVVYLAKVVAAPVPLALPRSFAFNADNGRSLYRFGIGGGLHDGIDGTHRLPITFGGMGTKSVGRDQLTFRGDTRPFAEDNPSEEPMGTAVAQWEGRGYRASVGDQPVELGPQLLATFPLRGAEADAHVGPVGVTLFGGTRATPALELLPNDKDPMARMLGGARAVWPMTPELKLSGVFAMAEQTPVMDLAGAWRRGPWSLMLEGAETGERYAAGVRFRREGETVTVDQRLTDRSGGTSALLQGVAGVESNTVVGYRLLRNAGATVSLSVLMPRDGGGLVGAWHTGLDWSPRDGVQTGIGIDRAFDGAMTVLSGTADAHSGRFGSVRMLISRTTEQDPAGAHDIWYEAGRAERDLTFGPIQKVFLDQTLVHARTQGSFAASLGVEAGTRWVQATVAPGAIVPTVTDPNGVAKTLALRIVATPVAAVQVRADVRRIWGTKPDTTVQFGLGLGFGDGTPWSSLMSLLTTTTLDGMVFVDQNGNGLPDPGEPGLAGVRVSIDGGASAVTDERGHYRVPGLKRGTYRVVVDRTGLPPNLRLASASPVVIQLPDGARHVSFAFAGSASIHGVVFNDLTLSGRFSGTEPGIVADLILEGPAARRTLSVSGAFSVSGLAPGHYQLTLDALALPPAFMARQPLLELDVTAGDIVTAQFPVIALRAVNVTACRGRRTETECRPGDEPAPGVKVTAANSTATTDSGGRALLRQLPAGQVRIGVDPSTIPPGWTVDSPVIVELPEGPTTSSVSIRLVPVGR